MRSETVGVIARLEFHIFEENAIAAEAAGQAKLFGQGTGGRHRVIFTEPI